MLSSFGLEGGVALMLARAAAVAALLSLFGTLVFQAYVTPRVRARSGPNTGRAERMVSAVAVVSAAAGMVALPAWLLVQAAAMAGPSSLSGALAAAPVVLLHTRFGHLIALQSLALAMAGAAYGRSMRRRYVALGLATIAVVLQAGHGHGASMGDGPSVLLAAGIIHLLGAGAWLGGLVPLALFVAAAPAKAGAMAARWFSPLGKVCVVMVAGSAVVQGWVLVGNIPGLVGTPYGWTASAKIGLFGILLGFAVMNRYRFAPALLHGDAGKRVLVRSITVQTGFGVAVIVAASLLSSVPPAMHVQPVWPFPYLLTLDTIQEDPDFQREVVFAALGMAGAVILLGCAWVMRHRARWLAAAAGLIVGGLAAPHLDLLFVPAYPTSYYQSPTGFAATSIMAGAGLFPQHCVACHGAGGRGDGPLAANLPVPPADLTEPHLWGHSDGELFWWLSHGIEGPDGSLVMPGFATMLTDDERWALIDYIRARNAGLAYASTGIWLPAVRAPELQAVCVAGRVVSLEDLRGRYVRVVMGNDVGAAIPGVTVILATADPAARPAPGVCVAADPAVPRAYAILAALDAGTVSRAQVLIDGDGVLRAVQTAGVAASWDDPAALAAEIALLQAQPVGPVGGGHMAMPM